MNNDIWSSCQRSSPTFLNFKMLSLSSGVAVISLLYDFVYFLIQELLFILDYYTIINNNYHHYYSYQFKKKIYKIEILTLELITKLLPLFLVTMSTTATATHAVNVTLLEGITFQFCPHFDPSTSTINDSLNSIYAIDLYEDKFQFIFDDVVTNGQKALFKDVPDRLRACMVDCIKQVLGAMARALNNGKYVNFQRGQVLCNGIVHFIKQHCVDVSSKCMKVLFSTLNIYLPLMVGVVDGLKIDELFPS